jgi:hypothetical protein
MNAACAGAAVGGFGVDDEIDVVAEGAAIGGIALAVAFFSDFVETEDVEEVSGAFCFVFEQGNSVETANCVLGWYVGEARGVCGGYIGVADDL